MLYIQVDTTLIDHPKTKKLARLLGVSRITAVGHLVALWSWAAQYALDGDLTQYRNEPDVLADGAEWEAEPEMFVSALIAAKAGNGHGFLEETIDGRLLLHDWDDYYGKLIERRRADAERKRAERAQTSSAEGEYVRRTSNGHPTDSERKSSVNVAYSSVTQRNESERSEAQRNAETDAAERAAALTPGPVVARASTTRTTVKPNSKVSKQVNLFAAVTGFFPVRQLHHIIDNAIAEDADQPFLKQCFETWLSRGYRKENLAWLTEWYASGSIPPAQRNTNGNGKPAPDALKAYSVADLDPATRATLDSMSVAHVQAAQAAPVDPLAELFAYVDTVKVDPSPGRVRQQIEREIDRLVMAGKVTDYGATLDAALARAEGYGKAQEMEKQHGKE